MSDAEPLEGQDTLPAEFPEPVMTADIFIKRGIEESLSQYAYFTQTLTGWRDEDEAAKERSILKGNMHLFASLLDSVIVDLLQQIQGVNREWADKAAADLDYALEGGDYYPEMIWQWATERGLDPEEISEKAKAKFAEKDKQ
ncbi:hypothetical protein SEA_EVEPICKLES_77 [Arthrobacter phage EvePickles]|nr:hypothetical protein SEA_EVEPICKLES_77 [Arthrobacter phage EvePickles]